MRLAEHVALDPLRQLVGEHREQQRLGDQEQHHAADDGHDAQEETAEDRRARGHRRQLLAPVAPRGDHGDDRQRHAEHDRDEQVPLERVPEHVEPAAERRQEAAEESHRGILTHRLAHAVTKRNHARGRIPGQEVPMSNLNLNPNPRSRFHAGIAASPASTRRPAGDRRHPRPPDRAAGGAVSLRAGGRRLAADERRRGRHARRRRSGAGGGGARRARRRRERARRARRAAGAGARRVARRRRSRPRPARRQSGDGERGDDDAAGSDCRTCSCWRCSSRCSRRTSSSRRCRTSCAPSTTPRRPPFRTSAPDVLRSKPRGREGQRSR